jgi:ribosomal protein S18 acetylase RimI-like enzyme
LISVRIARKPPTADIVALYKDAGWWKEDFTGEDKWIPASVKGSFLFAGAFSGKRMVGMARVISDGVGDAYIIDVTVLKEFRRQGIARRMVELLVSKLEAKDIDWILAIAEKEAIPFYKSLGVEILKGDMPIRFRRKA